MNNRRADYEESRVAILSFLAENPGSTYNEIREAILKTTNDSIIDWGGSVLFSSLCVGIQNGNAAAGIPAKYALSEQGWIFLAGLQ